MVFVCCSWNLLSFIHRYAVNLLYWDQVELSYYFFEDGNLWQIFSQQHGPHRQGLGGLANLVIAELSHWNTRWNAFGIGFCLIASAGLAILLAKRCGMKAGLAMAAIPPLFMGLRQYEHFVGPSNIAHAGLPVLLIMLYGLAWFIEGLKTRILVLGLLNFLLVFTGFGLFVGMLTPVFFALELWRRGKSENAAFRLWHWVGLAMAGTSIVLFGLGYRFIPAVDGFHFPHERPLEYLYFSGLMLNRFFGIPGYGTVSIIVGLLLLGVLSSVCAWNVREIFKHGITARKTETLLVLLTAFTLLYCANTAVGRVCLGLKTGPFASRYVTLLIPGVFAVLLQASLLPWRKLAVGLSVSLAFLLLPGALWLSSADYESILWFSEGKRAWRTSYLRWSS